MILNKVIKKAGVIALAGVLGATPVAMLGFSAVEAVAATESTMDVSGNDIQNDTEIEVIPISEEEPIPTPSPEPTPTPESAPECTCTSRCDKNHVDNDCPVCSAEYTKCEYVNPYVQITISPDAGWYTDSARVRVSVKDTKDSGNFTIYSVEAKIGQNGTWTDITDDMYIDVSENCTVYVKVTDSNNITYEKNKAIKCFDVTKPTFNAAVNDGTLTVQASDTQSGVKAVYVNGYEYTDLTNGTLTIRLQSFDASYEYFSISVMDNAGNVSDTCKVKNPYYTPDGEKSDKPQLPVSATPTNPTSAQATVTSHVNTDASGNTTADTAMSIAEQKKQAMADADAAEANETAENQEASFTGREFYTIQTDTEKVFYLIVDREGEEETVYFLTEISENDLLNVTSDNSNTLPMNSVGAESAIPVEADKEEVIDEEKPVVDDSNATNIKEDPEADMTVEIPEDVVEIKENEGIPLAGWVVLGIIGVGFIAAVYYFKIVKKKDESFLDEDDDHTSDEAPAMIEDEIIDEEVEDYFDDEDAEEQDEFLDGYEERD